MKQYGNLPENALAKKAQIGDYVAYDPTKGVTDTSKLTYTSPIGSGSSHGNGHSEQTFTANNTIQWRVLSKNEQTGEVVLISAEPINNDAGIIFIMNEAIGYLYAEQELNEICKIYGYGVGADTTKMFTYETGDVVEGLDKGTITGSGARSINIEDLNKITGYDPTTFTEQVDEITYKYGDSYIHIIKYPSKSEGFIEAKERSDTFTGYYYNVSEYIKDTTSNIYRVLFRNKTNNNNVNYWLASRGVYSYSDHAVFSIGVVEEGEIRMGYQYLGDNSDNLTSYSGIDGSVRPIVYLKSNIQTSGQNENGVWQISE